MNLTEAIQRVRFLIDDRDENPLVTDSDITIALETALDEMWQFTIDSGANLYTQQADVNTDAQGGVDLTALNPIKIVAVHWKVSGVYASIPAARPYVGVAAVLQTPMTLRILYVPRAVFPSGPLIEFIWSTAAISNAVLDQLVCAIAASQVWIRTGEQPMQSLERRIEQLKQSALSQINIPNVTVARARRGVSGTGQGWGEGLGLSWQRPTHNRIQLVY